MMIPMDEPDGGEPEKRFELMACAEIGIGADGGASTSIGLTGSRSAGISDRRRRECERRRGAGSASERVRCLRGRSLASERWCDERWRCWWASSVCAGSRGGTSGVNFTRGSAVIEMGRLPPVGETS